MMIGELESLGLTDVSGYILVKVLRGLWQSSIQRVMKPRRLLPIHSRFLNTGIFVE